MATDDELEERPSDIEEADETDVDEAEDEDSVGPLERLLAEEPGPLPFRGAESPTRAVDSPAPIPAATPRSMVCLRGPCVHYLDIETHYHAGNTAGSLAKAPRAQNRFCLAAGQDATDLTDELVTDCTHWDPASPDVVAARLNRRKEWLSVNAPMLGLKLSNDGASVVKED